jgi:hypothetical protein
MKKHYFADVNKTMIHKPTSSENHTPSLRFLLNSLLGNIADTILMIRERKLGGFRTRNAGVRNLSSFKKPIDLYWQTFMT